MYSGVSYFLMISSIAYAPLSLQKVRDILMEIEVLLELIPPPIDDSDDTPMFPEPGQVIPVILTFFSIFTLLLPSSFNFN